MRFKRDLLEYSLAVLSEEKEQAETLKEGIVEQISDLPLSVSFVNQEEALIRAAQTNHYWVKADEDAFDEVAAKLGPLMKFREQSTGQGQTHLDLADELHKKEWVEFGPQHEAVSITRYREMVENLIAELTAHNPVLQKIKNGEAVSSEEASELAELLHEERPHITEDLLRQVYKNRKARFIQFIRHILGIEVLRSFPDEVSAAFDQFIRAHTTLSSRQMEFLNLLKGFIIEREKVEKKDLINTPFTVIHPQGIRGVFSPLEINEILQLTERLGDKSRAFCEKALEVAGQHAGLMPRDFDIEAFRQDHLALAALRPRLARMAHLMQRMEDTERALGSDIMAAGLEIYGVLKVAGRDKGVDDARNALAERFSRRRTPDTAPPKV